MERSARYRSTLADKLAAVLPEHAVPDTARNRKLLAAKENYYGHGTATGTKVVKEFYDSRTDTSVLRAV